jgi:hypothetical protein
VRHVLAKTKFVSSVPSSMSNIFGCSARMVANRRRAWKVMKVKSHGEF